MSATIHVEVVYALPDRQWSVALALAPGASIADALRAVAAQEGFASLDLGQTPVGIWGTPVTDRARPLRDGDRVELYRPLLVDPADARRQRDAARPLNPGWRR